MRLFCSGNNSRKFIILVLLLGMSLFVAGCGVQEVFAPRQAPVPDAACADALEEALGVLGAPYVWGSRGPDEFDCSGLITWAYKKAVGGNAIFRVGNKQTTDATMSDLWKYNIEPLPPQLMRPGDIVFITSDSNMITHGGLFIRWLDGTEFEFINASSYYGKVVIDTWPVHGTKRNQWFAGAGRLKVVY